MSQRDARLQVPIDQEVLDKLQVRADELGFDSVPAMVRFWAKAETSDQLDEMRRRGLSNANIQLLHYLELILALGPDHASPAQALGYLMRQLKKAGFKKIFPSVGSAPSSDKLFET